jgi:hypothetical protein
MFDFKRVHCRVSTAVVFDEASNVTILLAVNAHVGEGEGLLAVVLFQFEPRDAHAVDGAGLGGAYVLTTVFSYELTFLDSLVGADIVAVAGKRRHAVVRVLAEDEGVDESLLLGEAAVATGGLKRWREVAVEDIALRVNREVLADAGVGGVRASAGDPT